MCPYSPGSLQLSSWSDKAPWLRVQGEVIARENYARDDSLNSGSRTKVCKGSATSLTITASSESNSDRKIADRRCGEAPKLCFGKLCTVVAWQEVVCWPSDLSHFVLASTKLSIAEAYFVSRHERRQRTWWTMGVVR